MSLKTVLKKIVLIFLVLLFLSSSSYHYDKKEATDSDMCRPSITEEGKISALLCCLSQDVKEQRSERFPFYFAYPIISEDKTFEKYDELMMYIDALFEKSKKRKNDKLFIRKKPSVNDLSSTWDFQLDDVKIDIIGEKANVTCNLIFYAAYPDTTDIEWKAPGRRMEATFTCVKKDNQWRISKIDKLFGFIEDVTKTQTPIPKKLKVGKSKQIDELLKGSGRR